MTATIGTPFTGTCCPAGVTRTSGDPRGYRSVDPLETLGSDQNKAASLPGRNGFLGDNSGTRIVRNGAQFLYTFMYSSQPDYWGGEWCMTTTTTDVTGLGFTLKGWNDVNYNQIYRFFCMDLANGGLLP